MTASIALEIVDAISAVFAAVEAAFVHGFHLAVRIIGGSGQWVRTVAESFSETHVRSLRCFNAPILAKKA